MGGNNTVFGVNFADGRIKGYPTNTVKRPEGDFTKKAFVKYVRGNTDYGKNNFIDNGDGTITDLSTGLMWMKVDSNKPMNWEEALKYAENLDYAYYTDWRLPNAKELQSIVDYSRSPDTSNSPAIDPIFSTSEIKDEEGKLDYPYYWTNTTHISVGNKGNTAIYIAFGRALGFMKIPPSSREYKLMDVHGAGAQRSDPKSGNPDDYPNGRGPQGDVIRIYNYVRCVRNVND